MSGGVPSWAVTSSSAAIFGKGSAKSSKAASSTSKKGTADTAAQQNTFTSAASGSAASKDAVHAPSSDQATSSNDVDSKAPPPPKPKQRPVVRCEAPQTLSRCIDQNDATAALSHLIALQASRAGFDASNSSALKELSHLTERFVTGIFAAASHAAELGSRTTPSARDLVYALETHGQPISDLRHFHQAQVEADAQDDTKKSEKARGKAKAVQTATGSRSRHRRPRALSMASKENDASTAAETHWAHSDAAFLPSDSDDGSEMDTWSVSSDSDNEYPNRRTAVEARVRKRKHDLERLAAKRRRREEKALAARIQMPGSSGKDLRALTSGEAAWHRMADHIVPRHLPGMPPRHTWIHTPAYPTNAYSADPSCTDGKTAKSHPLVLVNRKLANARLVESSLRRLIQSTDSAAALAYAAARRDPEREGDNAITTDANETSRRTRANQSSAARDTISPRSASPGAGAGASVTANPLSTSSNASFTVPRTPARGSLTLRLKNKISAPSSLVSTPGAGGGGIGVASPAGGLPSLPSPMTPGGFVGRRPTLPAALATPLSGGGSGFGFGTGSDVLMSPLTPMSGVGGTMTPLPPTPGGLNGQYFGSQFSWSTPNTAGLRSRSQSIALANNPSAPAGPESGFGVAGDDSRGIEGVGAGQDVGLQFRLPGPVNYKNVWYAPGSAIRGGGLASNDKSTASANHPRSVKRMRKWKV
ncbi:hypothetical protein BCV70DRAFT_199646 [Testicularia cyperi]|uniref:Transcription initiation factor TFIID subunit 8 n=1 Tax=Testicularia cyperi TaxID=1882483 RepID=A0A317XR41_9BASI|nr:hypothetical protein BCV70DRAFT_199646 [Testicularia cyperi]